MGDMTFHNENLPENILKITIYKDHRLLNGSLVRELGFQELRAKKVSHLCALVPPNMEVVDVHLPQIPHHLQLVVLWKKNGFIKKFSDSPLASIGRLDYNLHPCYHQDV